MKSKNATQDSTTDSAVNKKLSLHRESIARFGMRSGLKTGQPGITVTCVTCVACVNDCSISREFG